MSLRTTPPFRADHVGSLLRPPELRAARDDFAAGKIDAEALRAVEDAAIADAVKLQEDVGLQAATDGEFRRASWHMDFIYQLGGIKEDEEHMHVQFHNAKGDIEFSPAMARVYEKVTLPKTIFGDHFSYLEVAGHERGAEADDPVAEHGPLPQRPAVHQHRRVPGHGRVLERRQRRVRAGGAAAARARLPLPADGRHVLRLPERRPPAAS